MILGSVKTLNFINIIQRKIEMSETIKDIIARLKDGDNVNAKKGFDTAMADKMQDSLDAKKVEIASSMIQKKVEEPVEEPAIEAESEEE
tara:strand:- start:496 stop:762 length:267 start_codon:yes stop_codon:yes gene_type:complete